MADINIPRTYEEEMKYLERINHYSWRIKQGFVPNMKASLIL